MARREGKAKGGLGRGGRMAAVVVAVAILAGATACTGETGSLSPGEATPAATAEDEEPTLEETPAEDVPAKDVASAPSEDAGATEASQQASQPKEPASLQPSGDVVEGPVGPLTAKAPSNLADSDAYAALVSAIQDYEAKGYRLGFYLEDLSSGTYVAYNEHATFYSASCIKGPYAMALYQTQVDGGEVDESTVDATVQNLIVNSDNEAYRRLHRTYGEQFFADWIADAGYADGDVGRMRSRYYAVCSAADMAALWRKGYGYLTSGTQAATDLAGYLEARSESAIKRAVGDRYASWGKAGWYYSSDGYDTAPAMNDCGIVFAQSGTYLVALMSDGAGDFDAAAQVLAALDGMHNFIA